MLKSDQQGFLIGEVLDVSKEMLSGQRAGLEVLSRIDANVSAMLGRAGRASRYRRSETSPMFPSAPVVEPAPRRSGPIIRPYGPVTATVPVAIQRDSKGRFIKGSGGSTPPDGGAGGNPNPKEKPAPDEGRSSGENRIVEAIKETAAQSTDRMDPMIEAAKEVWEPLGRGWRASFGQAAEKKKERWYRRIWQALTKKRGDGQATAASASSGDSGLLSGITAGITSRLTGLLGLLPAVLGRVFAPVAAAWAAWEVGQWVGGKIHDWLVKSGLQDKLFDWVDGMRAGWSSMMDRLGNMWEDNVKKPAKQAVSATLNAAERIYDGGLDLFKGAAKSFSDGAAATNSWFQESTGVDVGAVSKNAASVAASSIKRLIGIDNTKRVYELADGRTETRDGGTVSWRNNNPGNLKFEHAGSADKTATSKRSRAKALADAQRQYDGVVDLDQFGNAIFSTPELGNLAQLKYIQRNAGDKTIEGMLQSYAVSDYSGVVNRPAYAASIHKFSKSKGVDLQGRLMRSLSPDELLVVAGAMKQFEGHKVGVSTMKPAATANVSGLSLPSMRSLSSIPPIGSAPDVSFPSMSSSDEKPIQISLGDQIGQNVSDRAIAHITTGGLGLS